MPIKVKIAETAKERNDVYKLRHQVYVKEMGCYPNLNDNIIVDLFDTLPHCVNIIAYFEGEAIGTIRINLDSEILLPADTQFDFAPYRRQIEIQAKNDNQPVLFCSATMLAITKQWQG
jgi:hypothetical protein